MRQPSCQAFTPRCRVHNNGLITGLVQSTFTQPQDARTFSPVLPPTLVLLLLPLFLLLLATENHSMSVEIDLKTPLICCWLDNQRLWNVMPRERGSLIVSKLALWGKKLNGDSLPRAGLLCLCLTWLPTQSFLDQFRYAVSCWTRYEWQHKKKLWLIDFDFESKDRS